MPNRRNDTIHTAKARFRVGNQSPGNGRISAMKDAVPVMTLMRINNPDMGVLLAFPQRQSSTFVGVRIPPV